MMNHESNTLIVTSYEVDGMMSVRQNPHHDALTINNTSRILRITEGMDKLSFQQVSGCIGPGRGVGVMY